MTRRILFVDDEPKILQAFERQLSESLEMETAPGPEEGLKAVVQNGPFAVVVSDFRMPRMTGIQFLSKVKQLSGDTVRVMLTGQADLTVAIAAVNQGSIFRFLTKPCPPAILIPVLQTALEQHRLITAERELLEKTLNGSIKVLTEVLTLLNPGTFSRASLIGKYARHMAMHLKLPNVWEVEIAAMLCQLGYITVPQQVLDKVAKGEKLTSAEDTVFSAHSAVAARLLENIPRLETVARMIGNQNSPSPGQESVEDSFANADVVAEGTTIVRTALEFDRLVAAGLPRRDAVIYMRQHGQFPLLLIDALETAEINRVERQVLALRVSELDATMIANQDIRTSNGVLLLAKGEDLTMPMIEKLRGFAKTVGIPQPISVLVPFQPQASAEFGG